MAYELESFINIIEQNQYFGCIDSEIFNQIRSLYDKAEILRDAFRSKSFPGVIPEYLENRVRDVVHLAEDAIDIHMTNQILSGGEASDRYDLDLTCLMEEFDSIKEEIMMLKFVDELGREMKAAFLPVDFVASNPDVDLSLLGLSTHMNGINSLITRESLKLQIISIIGSGGVGKTTVCRALFHFHYVLSMPFSIRVWISISRDTNMRSILLDFLAYIRKLTDKMHTQNDSQLGEIVYRSLKHKKFLIVVDNIYDTTVWDQLRKFFPDDNSGSLIILTTRSYSLPHHASSSSYTYEMTPMDEEYSWMLFSRELYGKMSCPPDFEDYAKIIAQTCQGSPLALKIMGKLLRQYKSDRDLLMIIFKAFTKEAANASDINEVVLSLSYKHLPFYFKPCFLYLGAFPHNYVLRPSRIIQFWIAEGFLSMYEVDDLEHFAEGIFYYFAHINLLMLSMHGSFGRETVFAMNDVVRDFCLKKSREDKYLWSIKDVIGSNTLREEGVMLRLSAQPISQPGQEMEQLSLARSFLCFSRASPILTPILLRMKLLRTLNVYHLEFYQFPTEILNLVLLRLLALSCHSALPSSISNLINLQTLIVRRVPSFRAFVLPSEMWNLAQLRHVESKDTCVVLHCPSDQEYVQETLQTLLNVQTIGITNEFFKNVPNLKKLGIFCNSVMSNVIDLACLQKLEMLKCSSDWSLASHKFLCYLTFSSSLKKLSLDYCKIPLGFMSIIGSLPLLQNLKVKKSDFLIGTEMGCPREPAWKTGEREFIALNKLHMEDLNLVIWEVNETSFPKLYKMVIRRCTSLVRIPTTVRNIYDIDVVVDDSSPLVLASMDDNLSIRIRIPMM